jgi:SAM-dependent methyltransferase
MPASQADQTTCRICLTTGPVHWYTIREMMYGTREEFRYFQCLTCECLQIGKIPSNISDYYPSKYYSYKSFNGKSFDGVKGKLKIFIFKGSVFAPGMVKHFLALVFPHYRFKALKGINLTPDTRILEVGCGNGDKYLYPLAEMGFRNLLGCDPFLSEPIHYDNGLVIRKADIFCVNGTWDVIIYNYVFEHVANPLENLQHASKLLSPGGVCIIGVPMISSHAWGRFNTNWYQLDAPRHFYIYSDKNMEILAHKSGLKISRVVFDSDYKQFTVSQGYEKNIPMNTPKERGVIAALKRRWLRTKYGIKALQLDKIGKGDLANFYLIKV